MRSLMFFSPPAPISFFFYVAHTQITLSQICRTNYQGPFPYANEISEETCRAFDQWWNNQLAPQTNAATQKLLPFINPQKGQVDLQAAAADFQMLSNRTMHASRESLLDNHKTNLHQSQHHHNNFIVHPALQTVHSQYSNQKTRMRTSFDPEMELPKLQRWFQENPHPSRQQIQSYVLQLNSLDSRRGRKPLDVNNVVYWFKNARAAQKRAELRGQGIGNGFPSTNQTGKFFFSAKTISDYSILWKWTDPMRMLFVVLKIVFFFRFCFSFG